jgi:hypothetical protein
MNKVTSNVSTQPKMPIKLQGWQHVVFGDTRLPKTGRFGGLHIPKDMVDEAAANLWQALLGRESKLWQLLNETSFGSPPEAKDIATFLSSGKQTPWQQCHSNDLRQPNFFTAWTNSLTFRADKRQAVSDLAELVTTLAYERVAEHLHRWFSIPKLKQPPAHSRILKIHRGKYLLDVATTPAYGLNLALKCEWIMSNPKSPQDPSIVLSLAIGPIHFDANRFGRTRCNLTPDLFARKN